MLKLLLSRILFLIPLIVWTYTAHSANTARPDTIFFTGDILLSEDIGKKLIYYIDEKEGGSDFETIRQSVHLFKTSSADVVNLETQTSVVWFYLSLKNQTNTSIVYVEIDNPMLNYAGIYYETDQAWVKKLISKDSTFDKREVKSQKLIFPMTIATGETRNIFFAIKSNSHIVFPLKIGTPEQISPRNNTEDILSGIYFGLMLVMFLYNLFIYFTVKDRSYLFYIIYIFCVALVQLNIKGLGFKYLWPSNPQFEQLSLFLFPSITAFASIAFIRSFLHTAHYTPKLNKGFNAFIAAYIVTLGIAWFGEKTVSYNLLNINALPLALYMIGIALYIWRKHKYRPAIFFLIAWTFFLVGIILFVLKEAGVFPFNIYTNSFILIGSAVEAILLSFALADKINTYRDEKEEAQRNALLASKENERIIKEQNITLETKVTERTKELKYANEELNKTLYDLKETQSQLVESEKMASLGQLTAGIAHEINNPINFVTSNVRPLKRDVDILLDLIGKLETIASTGGADAAEKEKQISALKTEFDFDYLQEEISFLLKGINEGSTRTAEIVKGLRIFSRVDEDDLKKADVNEGMDSTIIIINNLLGKIVIEKDYGTIPLVECYPGKLNQVFLNLISNAIYAINAKFNGDPGGVITITTAFNDDAVIIRIKDNGIGMNEATLKKLFEPFFTTKPVGEGTGLGLSISYNTIKKHNGTITVNSTLNEGTAFTIEIPIIQTIN